MTLIQNRLWNSGAGFSPAVAHEKMLRVALLLVATLSALTVGAATSKRPTWEVKEAPDPCDRSRDTHQCGFELLRGDQAVHSLVYGAVPEHGTYNHAAVIDYHDGFFLVTWKNSPRDEEQAGQRVLFATSDDGLQWSSTDGTNVLFPNVSTTASPAHLFAEPSLVVEGRRYAAASFKQYSIFPPPDESFMLLRRVYPDKTLGHVFWASEAPPEQYRRGAADKGVRDMLEMDTETQMDAGRLRDRSYLPCGHAESLKCEAVLGEGLPAHESAHWHVPGEETEVAMFRHTPLQWMHRGSPDAAWSDLSDTNFPSVASNINAGVLPSGDIYMLNNACPWSPAMEPHRDPLVVSVSQDGFSFTSAWGLTTCKNEHLGRCSPKYKGLHKDQGPSYPQGVTVSGKGEGLDGLYVAFTNNKEDVWVVKVPYSALDAGAKERQATSASKRLWARAGGARTWMCHVYHRLRQDLLMTSTTPHTPWNLRKLANS